MIEEFVEIYLVTPWLLLCRSLFGVSDFHVTPIFVLAIINYMLGVFSSSPPHNCEEIYLIKLSFSLERAHEFVVLVLETFQYSLRPKVRRVMSAIVEVS